MTELTVTKHHGLGNDFLVALDQAIETADLPALARRLCDRRTGIGADGLLVGRTPGVDGAGDGDGDGVDARMLLFNADGSPAEMSGNGIRCFAQALALRRGDVLPEAMTVATDAGLRHLHLAPGGHTGEILVSVDMGEVGPLPEPERWQQIGTDSMRPVSHLSVGNPHSVVAVDSVADVDLLAIGSIVPHVNLEIVEPGPERHAITMRVHERGAGITSACGTGAAASAWAAAEWGLAVPADGEIVVHMDGGDAKVLLHHPEPGRVTLVGPSELIGTIVVPLTGGSCGEEVLRA
jgi:diaminopimelate epimerase